MYLLQLKGEFNNHYFLQIDYKLSKAVAGACFWKLLKLSGWKLAADLIRTLQIIQEVKIDVYVTGIFIKF